MEDSDAKEEGLEEGGQRSSLHSDVHHHEDSIELLNKKTSLKRQRKVVTDFPDYTLEVKMSGPVLTAADRELLSLVEDREMGTVAVPDGIYDQSYPACGLFLLGFFCLVPWFFGAFYLKARNPTARTSAILSIVLLVTTSTVIGVVYLTGKT